MGSGKRASMREGPLAALFRKTETEGLEERPAAAEQPRDAPAAAPVAEEPAAAARRRPAHRRRRRSACATRSPPTCPRT